MSYSDLSNIYSSIYFTNVFNALTRDRKEEIKRLTNETEKLESTLQEILKTDKIIDVDSAITLAYLYSWYTSKLNVLNFSKLYGCNDLKLTPIIKDYIDIIERILIAESSRDGNLKIAIDIIKGKEFKAIPFNNVKENISLDFLPKIID